MLRDFIAIDFETANQEPSSVCSVGVVMVRDGQIVNSFYSLIQPRPVQLSPYTYYKYVATYHISVQNIPEIWHICSISVLLQLNLN